MAILTYSEAKTLLQISASTYDDLIKTQIPIVQDTIIQYTKNYFLNSRIYQISSGIAFTAYTAPATAATITDTAAMFVTNRFYAGMHLFVDGSYKNDSASKGILRVASVAAGTLTLDLNETDVVAESAEAGITLMCVEFPKALKMIAAKMIGFLLVKQGLSGVTSFSLGDYSETRSGDGGFPVGLLAELNLYRRTRLR